MAETIASLRAERARLREELALTRDKAGESDLRRQSQIETQRERLTRLGAHLTRAHDALAAAGVGATCCEETAKLLTGDGEA